MRYGEFVFYNTDNLSIDEKASMFKDCRDISYEWHADTLDCSISLSRRHFDCTFEEIMTYLKESSKVVVIDRGPWNTPMERWHFEIGFCTVISSIDYFLFIRVDREKMPSILENINWIPCRDNDDIIRLASSFAAAKLILSFILPEMTR